jgi:hypothetical protein
MHPQRITGDRVRQVQAEIAGGRWSAFSLDQQILMIGNEMNRAAPAPATGRPRQSHPRL